VYSCQLRVVETWTTSVDRPSTEGSDISEHASKKLWHELATAFTDVEFSVKGVLSLRSGNYHHNLLWQPFSRWTCSSRFPLGSLPHLSQIRIFEDSSTGIFTGRCPSYHPINGEEVLEEVPVLPNLQPLMPLFVNRPTANAINKWVCCRKLDEQNKCLSFASHCSEASTHTHTHTHTHARNRFTILFPGLPRWASARRNLPVVQGKITETDTPTIRLGATPSGLISDPPPSSSYFYARCPSCRNPLNLSWLVTGTKYAGLHTQWLGYIPSGLVKHPVHNELAHAQWYRRSLSFLHPLFLHISSAFLLLWGPQRLSSCRSGFACGNT